MELSPDDKLYSLDEAASRLRISRSGLYGLFKSGKLASVTLGARRLVSERACRNFIAALEGARS